MAVTKQGQMNVVLCRQSKNPMLIIPSLLALHSFPCPMPSAPGARSCLRTKRQDTDEAGAGSGAKGQVYNGAITTRSVFAQFFFLRVGGAHQPTDPSVLISPSSAMAQLATGDGAVVFAVPALFMYNRLQTDVIGYKLKGTPRLVCRGTLQHYGDWIGRLWIDDWIVTG